MEANPNNTEENRQGQKRKSEKNSRDDGVKQPKIVGESACFAVPKTSLLEDVADYFLQHKSSKLGFAIDIYTNQVKLTWKEDPQIYVQFEKFQHGCNVNTSDAPMEFHRNDFIDLALTTIMRIIRVSNFQSHSMCLSQYRAQCDTGNDTWVDFIKQFCKLRNAVKTYHTGTLLIAAFEKKDYEELTNFMQFGIWTVENEPVLTVNLVKYVKPTAVSYQHSKWNGIVPDEAPKIYDVVGCFDYYCESWEPLVSNCAYRLSLENVQEQVCQVTRNISSPIGKLQFRFRKNQGNSKRTCVSLVRVYAENGEVPEQKLRSLGDTKTCSDLEYNYHHNPITYRNFDYKNCTVLYSKSCCTECPECCEECEVDDLKKDQTVPLIIFFGVILMFVLEFAIISLCVYLCKCY